MKTGMKRFGIAFVLLLLAVWTRAQPSQPSHSQPNAAQPNAAQPDPVQGGTQDATDVLQDPQPEATNHSSWPDGSDRWLFNAEERTRAGQSALGRAATDQAVERFDTALRLAPDDAVARFNAGTARLTDQRPGARELLEAAAREAPASLKAAASYNLGNARLEASDLQGAIAAYEDALRADAGFADAKHNLEVALRRMQQQQQNQDPDQQNQDQQNQDQQDQEQQNQDQQNQDQQDQGQQQDQKQDDQNQDESSQDEQNQDQQNQDQQQDEKEQDKGSDETQESGGAGQGGEESPLPQFKDLPDMTAEEAAAILEAIQNMERQDRREQALEAAKKALASGKKDW